MKFVNLTPHEVSILTEKEEPMVLKSEGIARLKEQQKLVKVEDGVKLFHTEYLETENLPQPSENTIYIVSMLVAQQHADRKDLAYPARLIRDEKGVVIGCEGLNM